MQLSKIGLMIALKDYNIDEFTPDIEHNLN